MTRKETIFGIEITFGDELNTALIKDLIGNIPNKEMNLFETEFITKESVEMGGKTSDSILSESDKEFYLVK